MELETNKFNEVSEMKLKKLLLTLLIMFLSTGVLFACSAEDEEDPATDNGTEQQEQDTDAGDTEEEEPE